MKKRIKKLLGIGLLAVSVTVSNVVVFADNQIPVAALLETSLETQESETTATETEMKETTTPETTAPETSAPETTAPETTTPETSVPETEPPETSAPETEVPETTAPETSVTEVPESETSAPETTTPETEAPETSAPEIPPETEVPETQNTESTESETTVPETLPEKTPETEKTENKKTDEKGTEWTSMQENQKFSESDFENIGGRIRTSNYPVANVGENTKIIYHFLKKEMGLNHAAACGVLANIQMESNFNPLALGDGGTSYGICQWHNGRFSNLISYCNGIGMDYNTVEGQLQYLQNELASAYPGVLSYLRSVPDTAEGCYDAAYHWCAYFEMPSNTYERAAQRGSLAMNEYYPRAFDTVKKDTKDARDLVDTIRKSMKEKDYQEKMEKADGVENAAEVISGIRAGLS